MADEPTGALDSQSGQEVLAILNELNRRGHTVVMVTHDMKVARHAKRIIELCDGEIIADSGGCVSATETSPQTNSIRQSYWKTLLDRTRESMQMALKAMKTHRLRTTLTMIGIVFWYRLRCHCCGIGVKELGKKHWKRLKVWGQTWSAFIPAGFVR